MNHATIAWFSDYKKGGARSGPAAPYLSLVETEQQKDNGHDDQNPQPGVAFKQVVLAAAVHTDILLIKNSHTLPREVAVSIEYAGKRIW